MAPFEGLHKVVGWCMLSGGGAGGGGALSMGIQASTQEFYQRLPRGPGRGFYPLGRISPQ